MLYLYRGENRPVHRFETCWEVMKHVGRPLMAVHKHLRVRGSILIDDNACMCVVLKGKGRNLPSAARRFAQSALIHGQTFY